MPKHLEALLLEKPKTIPYTSILLSLLLLVLTIIASYFSAGLLKSYVAKTNSISVKAEVIVEDATQESVFEADLKPLLAEPVKLYAQKNDKAVLDLSVTELGVSEDGSMETPEDWSQAGWYKKSSRPGEEGNVVINAHYDDNYGRPAAFWGLKNLKLDDTVSLEDAYGRVHSYRVFKVSQVDIDDPNRLDVLKNPESGSILTMITCGGVWLSNAQTYDQRLVVQAELVEE